MTISRSVYNQLFDPTAPTDQVIRLRPTEAKAGAVVVSSSKNKVQMWTKEEHERFLVALEMYPAGPWKKIADYIGSKTPRQTMTHAQKYRQKIHRRQRGLRNQKKSSPGSPVKAELVEVHRAHVSTVHSPYGVADFQHKAPEYGVQQQQQQYAAANSNSNRLLDILAHSATAVQMQQPPLRPNYFPGQQPQHGYSPEQRMNYAIRPEHTHEHIKHESPIPQLPGKLPLSSQLPSLAEILHFRGTSPVNNAAAHTHAPSCACSCRCSSGAVHHHTVDHTGRPISR